MSSEPDAARGGVRPPGRDWRALLRGVAVGVGASIAAFLLTGFLLPVLPHTRLLLFYGAVMAAAWWGGHAAGILALVLCAFGAELFVLDPTGELQLSSAAALRVALFGLTAYGSMFGLRRLQMARAAADRGASDARGLATKLEAQARELEAQAAESEELAEEFRRVNVELRARNDAAERSARRTRRLQEITGALLRAVTPQQVGRVVLDDGLSAMEAELGLIAVLAPDGRTLRISSARGLPAERLERARVLPVDAPVPLTVAVRTGQPVFLDRAAGADLLLPATDGSSTGETPPAAWAVLPLAGRERVHGAVALGFLRDGEFSEEERTLLQLLAQECAQALERARLYEAERNARVKAEFAERQIAFLAEAGTRLAASLDYEANLQSLAELIVPELADWCVIHLAEGGRLRLAAAAHNDRGKLEVLREIGRRYPPRPAAPIGSGHVFETREPELVREVSAPQLEAATWDEEHLELLRRVAPRSEVCVPLLARDTVLGTITLVISESARHYTPADLALAEEVAGRAAQAIENAQLYEDTRTASQAKSDFLAVMSHELRTPLNAILGYADLVLLGVPGSVAQKTQNYVERIRLAAQELLRLVDEVLSFARLEAGKEVIRVEAVDLNVAVREAVALVESAAQSKGIHITLELPDTPLEVATDGWKVRQILTNLLSNAVKFTSEGGAVVAVEAEPTGIRLAVSDTGIGIPPEHIEHIFDPFWQVEQSSTRRYGGAGLGLGVARELARLLGGQLTVQSEVGRGSTFVLRLPHRPPANAGRNA